MKHLIILSLLLITSLAHALTITSYNIRTFEKTKNYTDKTELKKIINATNSDLIAVQEIVNTKAFTQFVTKNMPDYKVVFSSCGGAGRQKIGFVYRFSSLTLTKLFEDKRFEDPSSVVNQGSCSSLRPALLGYFTHKRSKKKFVAVGLHLKAGARRRSMVRRWEQYELINTLIKELKSRKHTNIVLLGDFNSTGYVLGNEDYNRFESMLSAANLTTESSKIECSSFWGGTDYTDGIEESSILDHIIYSKNFMGLRKKRISVGAHCKKVSCFDSRIEELGKSYKGVSDHCPVVSKLN